ncbi:hypothetical protein PM082_005138 [Marasmius tenuissimus]|nr:hypothetical protein PM082_005138 [Marasmius tenuissimus]
MGSSDVTWLGWWRHGVECRSANWLLSSRVVTDALTDRGVGAKEASRKSYGGGFCEKNPCDIEHGHPFTPLGETGFQS